ncbi:MULTISPECIES: 6-carboxytetrahydropterin synthase [unclassified Prochlorococcus]|uniref:6-carboxytetrahydropterin synthase n=1 Tax=unclassified Prochlorococcus TaxID=2627481 RepID=UPI00055F8E57|nr:MULTISPECIES: 6-carboxytetrahydropterin synthase [unclassified Prochlorococcus]
MPDQTTGFSCSKHFEGFPCCHRQWRHSGHCSFVHGYSRKFTFWFRANALDQHGFVVDFSSLYLLEQKLKDHFDHTFLVNKDDPMLPQWQKLHDAKALDLRIMENVGMESTAKIIWEWANLILLERDSGRTCCFRAQASENDFNSACFELVPDWFRFT